MVTCYYAFVTGSRNATKAHAKIMSSAIRGRNADCSLIHGGCRGADLIAANMLTWKSTMSVPANWSALGRRAGPIRNKALVDMALALQDAGHRVCFFAFPMGTSVGTRGCISLALEAGLKVVVTELDA